MHKSILRERSVMFASDGMSKYVASNKAPDLFVRRRVPSLTAGCDWESPEIRAVATRRFPCVVIEGQPWRVKESRGSR